MHHFTKRRFLSFSLALIVVGASFFAGWQAAALSAPEIESVSALSNKEEDKPAQVDFSPFWKAWNVINEKHVAPGGTSTKPVVDQDKVWGAISGLAGSLNDPYTVFLPPSDAEVFESNISGNFQGVGMEIGNRDGVLTVVSPLKGTPAESAGIKAGDKILQINGSSTENVSTTDAVKRIRGEAGTEVSFLIYRESGVEEGNNPFSVKVTRKDIDIPTLETELRDDGVFVIELYNFSAKSSQLFKEGLQEFTKSGSRDLIVDLRGNPGGYLQASIDMASWFLPQGKVVVREGFGDAREDIVYRSKGYDIFGEELDMAIVVNGGSASASEILAGALKEHDVAKLVGTQTFGKGSVQELINITPEASLKLTVAQWFTPDGTSISQNGLTPDVEVEITEEDIAAGRDPQIQKAAELLLEE